MRSQRNRELESLIAVWSQLSNPHLSVAGLESAASNLAQIDVNGPLAPYVLLLFAVIASREDSVSEAIAAGRRSFQEAATALTPSFQWLSLISAADSSQLAEVATFIFERVLSSSPDRQRVSLCETLGPELALHTAALALHPSVRGKSPVVELVPEEGELDDTPVVNAQLVGRFHLFLSILSERSVELRRRFAALFARQAEGDCFGLSEEHGTVDAFNAFYTEASRGLASLSTEAARAAVALALMATSVWPGEVRNLVNP